MAVTYGFDGYCGCHSRYALTLFDIICSGSTVTQTQSVELRPCEAGNPDSPSYPDCEADGWVTCETFFQGNVMTGGGGFTIDLQKTGENTFTLKVAAAILCDGHGCASDALYSGTRSGGIVTLTLDDHSDIGDDPVTEYLGDTSCLFVPNGTVVTWPATITLTQAA